MAIKPFNINQYQTQASDIDRQRKMAELLRQQGSEPAQGSMSKGFSGGQSGNPGFIGSTTYNQPDQYVPPSALEHVGNLAKSAGSAYMGYKADQAQSGLNQQVGQAQQEWQSSMPQATPGSVLPQAVSKDEEGNAYPEIRGPALPVTLEQIYQHAARGHSIPGNEKMAEMYATGATKALEREDTQAQNRANLELQQETLRNKNAEDARLRQQQIDDKKTADSRHEDEVRFRTEALKEIARNRVAASTGNAAGTAAAKAEAKSLDIPKHMSDKIEKIQGQSQKMTNLADGFDEGYAGIGGAIKTWAGDTIPGYRTKASEWWRDYRADNQLSARHSTFGATLSKQENEAWDKADINERMNGAQVKENLAKRKLLMRIGYIKTMQNSQRMGKNVHSIYAEDPAALNQELMKLQGQLAGTTGQAQGGWQPAAQAKPSAPVAQPAASQWKLVK